MSYPDCPAGQALFLAIDQGGQSSRIAVFNQHGERLFLFTHALQTSTETTGNGVLHIEQDATAILDGIREGLEAARQWAGEYVNTIRAAGFAGQGSSMLCWNRITGETLSPVLSWQDRRAADLLDQISLSQAEVIRLTGLRKSPHYGASKMRWCMLHNQRVTAAAEHGCLQMGPIASYVIQQLGQASVAYVDPGHGQRTLLWNLHTHDWDEQMLSAFAIERAWLPECVTHTAQQGAVMVGETAVSVTACMRDQGASLFARGQPDRHGCYVNIGTGAFIQCVTDNLSAPEGLLVSPLLITDEPDASLYAWEATVNGAASALTWLGQACGETITPALIDRAAAGDEHLSGFLLNAVGGLSAPYWRVDLESRFVGVDGTDQKVLAWIESVLFQIAINIELMAKAHSFERIFLSGGLARATGVAQKLADLTGLIVVHHDDADATLQGIAWVTAGQPSSWQFPGEDVSFAPKRSPSLNHRYDAWRAAMTQWLGTH